MSSPLSDVGVSLAKTAILRILEDARNHEARLNAKLVEQGQPALEPFFYTRDQMAEVVASHESAIAAMKPKAAPHWTEGWRDRQRREEPSSIGRPDDSVFVDMTAGALRDRRLRGRRLREGLRLLLLTFRPSGDYGGRVEVTPERARAVATWCDAMATMPLAPPKDDDAQPVGPSVGIPTHGHSPADLARAAALASGIEFGEIVALDRDKVAAFIRESYDKAQEPRT